MLTLIEGGFFSDRDERIWSAIKARVSAKGRTYLLVPEQQTVMAESLSADKLPADAPLYFEATNFTRFSDTVLRSIGGISGKCADAPTRALIMWRTLTELSPILELTARAEITENTVNKSLSAVAKIQSLGIDPDALSDACYDIEKLIPEGGERLKGKLNDLSRISALYTKMLTERFSGSADTVSLLGEKLRPEIALLADSEIFIDGFTSFTEPQYRVIEKLASFLDVTVSLCLPRAMSDAFEFKETKAAHDKLLRIGALAGCDVRVIKALEDHTSRPMIKNLCYALWHTNERIDPEVIDKTRLYVYEAQSPYDECDFLASDIKRRVMFGDKYSDFAIISRSISSYSGIIDTAFEKAGIPLFISKRKDISSTEGIKLIYTALSAVISGFSAGDVISYSKCSLCGVPRELSDELELYVNTWQINGRRFTDGIVWNMNPGGYTSRRSPDTQEKLLRIDEARRAIVEPLMSLDEALSAAVTVRDHAVALLDFLLLLSPEKKLSEKADQLDSLGLFAQASDTRALWRAICSGLDTLVEAIPDVHVNKRTFLTLLKIVFSYTDIGRLPSNTEEVTAASADTGRVEGKRHVYLIGASFGAFPLGVFDDEYFTEKDGEILEQVGLVGVCERSLRSARELYYVMRSISLAKEDLTVIYPSANASFDAIRPSDIVTRITEMTGGEILPRKLSELTVEERIYNADLAAECGYDKEIYPAVRSALLRAGYGERIRIYEAGVKNVSARLGEGVLKTLYRGPLALTQSRIDRFVGCPMNYFCTYDLKLKTNERAEFEASDIGSFVHALLESFFIELKARGKSISDITHEEKLLIVRTSAERYVSSIFEGIPKSSARMRVNIDRLSRAAMPAVESLCREFADCRYEPVFFELGIDRGNSGNPEAATFKSSDGRDVYVYGTIDRVDRFISNSGDVYVRVIDYKTGSKEFSPEDLEKGKNLQMFLYLKSVSETENESFRKRLGAKKGASVIPAGLIYMKADISDGKLDREEPDRSLKDAVAKQKRFGMLLDDDQSLSAMNRDTLPIKISKSGEIKKDPDSFYSLDGWERINETLSRVVGDIADKILSGEISALPLKRGSKGEMCKYCDFKSFCRNPKV